jgi:hypothetical protein
LSDSGSALIMCNAKLQKHIVALARGDRGLEAKFSVSELVKTFTIVNTLPQFGPPGSSVTVLSDVMVLKKGSCFWV